MTGTKQTLMPDLEAICLQIQSTVEGVEPPTGAVDQEMSTQREFRMKYWIRGVVTHGGYISPIVAIFLLEKWG